jgi:Tol biopolymer transport system component
VAGDGTLVHALGPSSQNAQLVLVDRSGRVERPIGGEQQVYPSPRFSPDGRFVMARVTEGDNRDIWITDVVRGTRTRLTFDEGPDDYPSYSPDGTRAYYSRGSAPNNFTIWMAPVDGSAAPVEITRGYLPFVSPDQRHLVYALFVDGNWQVYAAALNEDGTRATDPFPVLRGSGIEYWGQISPDGAYMAYVSDESGREEVYVTRFPSGKGKWQVSLNGGYWPCWTRGGREILFVEENRILSVEVEIQPAFRLGSPQLLFEHPPSGIARTFNWPDAFHATPDGEHLVLAQSVGGEDEQTVRPGLVVVQNWIAEFEK